MNVKLLQQQYKYKGDLEIFWISQISFLVLNEWAIKLCFAFKSIKKEKAIQYS